MHIWGKVSFSKWPLQWFLLKKFKPKFDRAQNRTVEKPLQNQLRS